MDANSWVRRSFSKLKFTSLSSATATGGGSATSNDKIKEEEEERLYGVTVQFIEFVKSFSFETFRNFFLPDEQGAGGDGANLGNVQKDLSDWQEKHAMVVLSRIKELAQLRFKICPRYMKERQFWRIYFTLVRSYLTEYELRSVRLDKLKQIRLGNETVSNSSASEVEMSEAKFIMPMESATSEEQK